MRKLFRMKYEPCTGACYTPEEVLGMAGLGLSTDAAAHLLKGIVSIHDLACGNQEIAYGLDHCPETGAFVASFLHYGQLDLFSAKSPLVALYQLIDAVLVWFASGDAAAILAQRPGRGHQVCEHGDDQDLRRFALRHSGLPAAEQAAVLASL